METPPAKTFSLEDAEEKLDLVDPGGVLGGVVEDEAIAVPSIEADPALLSPVVVNVQVIPDDMDGLVGILTGNPGHEAPEVSSGPGWTALLDDTSSVHGQVPFRV